METVMKIEGHPVADGMVSMIERVALDPNASIEKLERMLAMRESIMAADAKAAFSTAFAEIGRAHV